MKLSEQLFRTAYRVALAFYPAEFRRVYGAAMEDAAKRLHAESRDDLRLCGRLLRDLVVSCPREWMRTRAGSSAVYVLGFVFVSGLLLTVSVVHQQIERRAANRAPATLVRDFRGDGSGLQPHDEIASSAWLSGGAPFTALYDSAGAPLAADATLDGSLPAPPRGIFNTIRAQNGWAVTWQPRRGVRVALVSRPLPDGRFVVAGESLASAERSVGRFDSAALAVWVLSLAGFVVLALRRRTLRAA